MKPSTQLCDEGKTKIIQLQNNPHRQFKIELLQENFVGPHEEERNPRQYLAVIEYKDQKVQLTSTQIYNLVPKIGHALINLAEETR